MLKRFLSSPAGLSLQGRLIGWYVLLAGFTTRWTEINRAVVETAQREGGPVIVCFWHNRLLLVRNGWPRAGARRQKLAILISNSRDGEVVSQTCRTVGFRPIRGSSAKQGKSKGVVAAWREALAHIAQGGAVGFTPDGPRGPRMRVQMGAVQLAKRTGAPIVCFAWSQDKRRVVRKSWDRHVVPTPFSKGVMIWGGPLRVAKNADDSETERARLALEAMLNDLSAQADRAVGVAPIEPEAPADASAPEPAET